MIKLARTPILGLAALLLLAACNTAPPGATTGPSTGPESAPPSSQPSGQPSGQPTGQPSGQPSGAPSESPSDMPTTDPSETPVAVIKIEQTGGMLPLWEALRWYPPVVVYSDGRVMTQGPQIEIYPGPALPNLRVTHLTQAGVAQLLQWAAEAGLDGPDRDLGQPNFDAGQVVFTVVTQEGTHRTSVWDPTSNDPAVTALFEFQNVATDARSWMPAEAIGDDEPYNWDRLRMISFEADPASLPEPGLATTRDWPLDPITEQGVGIDDAGTYRCAELSGEDAEAMKPLLAESNELTMWRSEDVVYQVYFRPLLPGEEACPGL